MSGSEKLGLCCLRLKNNKQGRKIVETVNRTMDAVFEDHINEMLKEAEAQGHPPIENLKGKLKAVARSHGFFAEYPPSPEPSRKMKD